jgi:hypothetical protein
MKGKSLSKPALITLIILAAGLAITLAGCTGAVSLPTGSSSSTSLGKAATCKSVDPQTEEAIEPASVFTADTPEIFCSVKLSNAPSGTEVSAEWLYLSEATGGNDLLIDSWSRVTEGTRHVSTSIVKPANGWPQGNYKVVLYLNGNENQSIAFSVQ